MAPSLTLKISIYLPKESAHFSLLNNLLQLVEILLNLSYLSSQFHMIVIKLEDEIISPDSTVSTHANISLFFALAESTFLS